MYLSKGGKGNKMLIKMENVKYRYKRNLQVTSAIDGINVKIDKGEFISIIGRNGSGKSTFAKLLNAILIPTEGDVYIKGVKTTDENHLWEIKSRWFFKIPTTRLLHLQWRRMGLWS